MTKVKILEAIVVEGKHDKIKLALFVDALIIETEGFRIFSSKDFCNMLEKVAEKHGIIVLTDSDGAGLVIRNYISGMIDRKKIKHAYIPKIEGKEARKKTLSKEGLLGVEGIDAETLKSVLVRAGATFVTEHEQTTEKTSDITMLDLLSLGLYGKEESSVARDIVLSALNFPFPMTAKRFLAVVNSLFIFEELEKIVRKANVDFEK